MKDEKKMLPQFQGLRAVAFLAIFISHARVGSFGALGAWGVSVFLCLSGFLMAYNYLQRENRPQFGLGFAWHKIKKLYPLHIATMLGAILYFFVAFRTPVRELATSAILHTALIQVWIPWAKYYSTLNGVAWYLSACVFCYFCFPLILKMLDRCRKPRNVKLRIGGLLFAQVIIAVLAGLFGAVEKNDMFSMQWITYYCPISRCVDFAIGCCLGYVFLNRKNNAENMVKYSLFEMTTLVCVLLACAICTLKSTMLGTEYIRYTLLFMPSTILVVWLTAKNGGIITKQLQRPFLVKIGNISPYGFLIHPLAIWFSFLLMPKILPGIPSFIPAIFALALTFVAISIWRRVERYLVEKTRFFNS